MIDEMKSIRARAAAKAALYIRTHNLRALRVLKFPSVSGTTPRRGLPAPAGDLSRMTPMAEQ